MIATTDAQIIKHEITAPLMEVIPAAMAKHAADIIVAALDVTITDAKSAEQANRVSLQLHQCHKELVAHGESLKRPINQLLKAVRSIIDSAEVPLANMKSSLQGKLAAWKRQQDAIIAEAQAKADQERRDAEAAAAAEQKRLQEIENARVAEANRVAAAKAKEIEELIGTPVAVKEVKADVVPTVRIEAPKTVVPVAAESAIVIKLVTKVEVFDPKALAAAYSVAGEVLVDIRAGVVRRLLDAGIAVPGARFIQVEEVAQRAVR